MTSLLFTALMQTLALAASAEAAPAVTAVAPPAWDVETVRLFQVLPVQEGGRVKPLDTLAGFRLLQLNGRRKCKLGDGTLPYPLNRMIYPNRKPTEWLLDCLFYPEVAKQYAVFLVQNSDVITALGAAPLEGKRGRFSYAQLENAHARVFELASQYTEKDARELDTAQREIIRLATNIRAFESLIEAFDFARNPIQIPASAMFKEIFGEAQTLPLSAVLRRAQAIEDAFTRLPQPSGNEVDPERAAFHDFFRQLDYIRQTAGTLALFPAGPGEPWLTVSDVVTGVFAEGKDLRAPLADLEQLEQVIQAAQDPAAFAPLARAFQETVVTQAKAEGAYRAIGLEAGFYRAKLFYRALILYFVAFALIAATWLLPGNRFLRIAAPVGLTIPTLLLTAGIVLRCIIRQRPPVTTLYETILFVTAMAVALSLALEWFNRQRIALALGGILGAAGMLLANKYEAAAAEDTMPSMVAVLDTNFWLTAHVTTIVIGYAASLLTGALAHIYILGRMCRWRRNDPAFYPALARMVYGVLCFGFFFTFTGTVLGGIWANESWGRFWGWDPKENGALLIVLWQLATMHARLGGYIRDLGIAVASVVGAAIVAFSWWGVNLLGVGLHTYGFTHGTMNSLLAFWIFEGVIVAAGLLLWLLNRAKPACDQG